MQDRLELPKKNGKKLVIDFEGGNISSDSGFLLLSKMEDRIGLLRKVSSFMPDDRLPSRIKHTTYEMLRQRVFGIACGYEDINDHTDLRHDALLQSLLARIFHKILKIARFWSIFLNPPFLTKFFFKSMLILH